MQQKSSFSAVFVGLITLDLIYLVEQIPQPNQKMVALDGTVSAGGPATNAAVTFSHLGGGATLLGVLGNHPMGHLIKEDLTHYQVAIADLQPDRPSSPAVSSILVTRATGERAVVSLNAVTMQALPDQIPPHVLQGADIVLIDGHQMAVGEAIAQQARAQGIPVVVDGGSWKPGFEKVLSVTDYAICSANFWPPGCQSSDDVFSYLSHLHIPHIAVTHGHAPIQYLSQGDRGECSVPQVQAVDTLGAGDIFHGAFCHGLLQAGPGTEGFSQALTQAAKVAAHACQFFGTRRWMAAIAPP